MDNLNLGNSPDLLKRPSIISGVKTLNKKPLFIILIAFGLLLLGLGYAASLRSQSNAAKASDPEQTNSKNVQDRKNQLSSMVDDLEEGARRKMKSNVKKDSKDTDPLGQYPETTTTDTPSNGDFSNMTTGQRTQSRYQEQARENDLKRAADDERKRVSNAINAPTKIKIDSGNAFENTNKSDTQNQTLLAQGNNNNGNAEQNVNRNTNLLVRAAMLRNGQDAPTNNDERNEPFMNKADKSYDYLATEKATPKSPYEVKAGTVIPGTMITGINSDLPGQILGMVSENVYDTATGRHLLIPQGSKLVGLYSANVIFGQERVLIAWNRIIFPDAKTLNIGAMPGTDQAGYAGFSDLINNHYMKIFGSAFVMSMISGTISLSSKNNGSQYTETNTDKMVGAMVQQMGEVGKQMIQKNLNISPTLEIRPGYKFNIFITKDIILEPLSY